MEPEEQVVHRQLREAVVGVPRRAGHLVAVAAAVVDKDMVAVVTAVAVVEKAAAVAVIGAVAAGDGVPLALAEVARMDVEQAGVPSGVLVVATTSEAEVFVSQVTAKVGVRLLPRTQFQAQV